MVLGKDVVRSWEASPSCCSHSANNCQTRASAGAQTGRRGLCRPRDSQLVTTHTHGLACQNVPHLPLAPHPDHSFHPDRPGVGVSQSLCRSCEPEARWPGGPGISRIMRWEPWSVSVWDAATPTSLGAVGQGARWEGVVPSSGVSCVLPGCRGWRRESRTPVRRSESGKWVSLEGHT